MDLTTTKVSHYNCHSDANGGVLACGRKLYGNIVAGKDSAFDEIDQFHVYGELDANTGSSGLILPQYRYLKQIYHAFPNATWVLNTRNATQWLSSIDRWQNLRERFVNSDFRPDLPPKGRSKDPLRQTGEKDADMIRFYHAQAQRVRDFVKKHPSLHLVEVAIDEGNAGNVMEDAFGISSQCWGNKNVNTGNALWTES
ncbi:MAG: hypothetical protein SGARI_002694, partial [Bacillariaceae sp.]